MAMVVESAGLVGAALRRSPAAAVGVNDAPFKYPEVRSWMSFSAERLYSRSLALISALGSVPDARRWLPCFGRWEPKEGPSGIFMPRHFPIVPSRTEASI
jgi:hypothetical protein